MARTQRSPRKEVSRPVWAEVSLSALAQNLQAIRKYVNPPQEKRKTPRKILCIVKGNGLGHFRPAVPVAVAFDDAKNLARRFALFLRWIHVFANRCQVGRQRAKRNFRPHRASHFFAGTFLFACHVPSE